MEVLLEQRASVADWRVPYRFTGKEQDCETGLYYYGARYYDAKVSRFLSVDPLAEKYPDLSPYNYVANNPLNFVDFNGDSISIPANDVQARKDIRSLLPASKKYNGVISYDGDLLQVDDSGLTERQKKRARAGLDLLKTLSGKGQYFYSANINELKFPNPDGSVTVENINSFPDNTKGPNEYGDYDGAAFTPQDLSVWIQSPNGGEMEGNRESVVFHALWEAYAKSTGLKYRAAHAFANQKAMTSSTFHTGNITGYQTRVNGNIYFEVRNGLFKYKHGVKQR